MAGCGCGLLQLVELLLSNRFIIAIATLLQALFIIFEFILHISSSIR